MIRRRWFDRGVDGVGTVTGRHKPKQLATFKSQRSALAAASETKVADAIADKGTLRWLVRRYVAGGTAECRVADRHTSVDG